MHSEDSGEGNAGEALAALRREITIWGDELGFDAVRVAGVDLSSAEAGVQAWLQAGFHGEMDYMSKHGSKRTRPAELVPNTCSVISARMSYLPDAADPVENLRDPERAYISRYALGRDYHKVLRSRLQQLANRIAGSLPHGYRVFVDSAPVMEVELASRSGLGWRGKHSLLLDRSAVRCSFLVRSIPTWCFRQILPWRSTADHAAPALMGVLPGLSSLPTGLMPGDAFHT